MVAHKSNCGRVLFEQIVWIALRASELLPVARRLNPLGMILFGENLPFVCNIVLLFILALGHMRIVICHRALKPILACLRLHFRRRLVELVRVVCWVLKPIFVRTLDPLVV